MKKLFIATMSVLLLGACVSNYNQKQDNRQDNHQSVAPQVVVPEHIGAQYSLNEADIFRLTAEQEADFKAWFYDPIRIDEPVHDRVYYYLDKYTDGFDYRGNTYNATQAMTHKAGNCLSLAIMTTALAKIVGVEVGYQLVNATPVYKKRNNVLLLSYHVRTFLYDPSWRPKKDVITLIRPRLIVDYFPNRYDVPGDEISEQQFMGMYYRNLAADALLQDQLSEAFWFAEKALSLAANDAENINMMAVIYRRLQEDDLAEAFYQYGMAAAENNTNLLSNYAVMLEAQNRPEQAELIRQKLLEFPDSNPYAWIKLGHDAFLEGQHGRAISYYQRAMALAPYLDEIYFGLAKSLYQRGEFTAAAEAMRTAAEKSWEQSQRQLYYAKLSALRARKFDK
ncbi:tetratricopeptide repeat protein [Planctobacterium marinum]|uniref:Tetratricopeptide repeat protein n=1 Tax=Planctobacterium marinum TaxID=1631968 RepID=A0AA48KR17_9ALTE|nr:hypothetical protein MACH26_11630 [Planctobacterium marinum]